MRPQPGHVAKVIRVTQGAGALASIAIEQKRGALWSQPEAMARGHGGGGGWTVPLSTGPLWEVSQSVLQGFKGICYPARMPCGHLGSVPECGTGRRVGPGPALRSEGRKGVRGSWSAGPSTVLRQPWAGWYGTESLAPQVSSRAGPHGQGRVRG